MHESTISEPHSAVSWRLYS